MKKSYLIQKLREAIRMQILKDKPLMEAEKIATGKEESEEEDQELDQTVVGKPEEKEKQIGPDTEVGNIQTVAPPAAGTVTTVNLPSTKIEPTSPPAPVSADATVDKSKETDAKVSPGDDITKPDGVDTTGKVEPVVKNPTNIINTKGEVDSGDVAKMLRSLGKDGYTFKNVTEDQIRQILHNTGDVSIRNNDVAKKIGSKMVTIIFTKKSTGKPRVINGQIGSINKSFGGSNNKRYYMGTPVKDVDNQVVTNIDGKPLIKYPGEWGAKYGLDSSKLKSYDLIPILANPSSVTMDSSLKNAAGDAKPNASRWRTISVPSVKAIIYKQTIYWKK
jgi:hypothetical protein